MNRAVASVAMVLVLLGACTPLLAQERPSPPDPAVVGVEAATDAYLATVPAEAKARSDAYFEGGYWFSLWQFLWSSLVLILLLQTGLSGRLRDAATRMTRGG